MFGQQAFNSWSCIVFGAICFGLLFGLVVLMGEALYDGNVRFTRAVVGIGVGAFMGYLAVGILVRNDEDHR